MASPLPDFVLLWNLANQSLLKAMNLKIKLERHTQLSEIGRNSDRKLCIDTAIESAEETHFYR